MSKRSIPFYERHVDKVLFTLAGVALVGVFVWQFATPVRIDVDSRSVPIGEVGPLISQEARTLDQLMSSPPSFAVPGPAPRVAEPDALLASTSEAPPLNTLAVGYGDRALDAIDLNLPGSTVEDAGRFATVQAPAPTGLIVGVFEGGLPVTMVDTTPGLESMLPDVAESSVAGLPARRLRDVRGVSVQATVDPTPLLDVLLGRGDFGVAPVPERWWRDRLEILDVELTRREVRADGRFSREALLPHLPGGFVLREELDDPMIEPVELRRLASRARNNLAAIRRPAMFDLASCSPWASPAELAAEADPAQARQRAEELRGEITDRVRTLAQVDRQLNQRDRTLADDERQRLEAQQERLTVEIDQLRTQLGQLGYVYNEGQQNIAPASPGSGRRSLAITDRAFPVEPSAPIMIWAHDLSAEPGRTYQYRLRVRVTNPYFGQGELLMEDQRSLADGPTLRSAATEWSTPIRMLGYEQFFVADASAAASVLPNDRFARPASVSVELYRFFSGCWRVATETFREGDSVTGTIVVDLLRRAGPTVAGAVAPEPVELGFAGRGVVLAVREQIGVRAVAGDEVVILATPDGELRSVDVAAQAGDRQRLILQGSAARGEEVGVPTPGGSG
ncbi:MAG: hypothetical protein AAGI30_13860 [Planctomycetota bacterium]